MTLDLDRTTLFVLPDAVQRFSQLFELVHPRCECWRGIAQLWSGSGPWFKSCFWFFLPPAPHPVILPLKTFHHKSCTRRLSAMLRRHLLILGASVVGMSLIVAIACWNLGLMTFCVFFFRGRQVSQSAVGSLLVSTDGPDPIAGDIIPQMFFRFQGVCHPSSLYEHTERNSLTP